jgi:hypothetical protein
MLVDANSLQALSDAGSTGVGPGSLAVSATDVYYTAVVVTVPMYSGEAVDIGPVFVMRVPLVGGASTIVASGPFFVRPAINSSSVVLLGQVNDSDNGILTVPLTGGSPTTVATFSLDTTDGFVVDDRFAYFATTEGIEAVSLDSGGGGDAGIIALTQDDPLSDPLPDGIGLFGAQLLFGLNQGGIESVPLPPQPGSKVTVLGSGPPGRLEIMPCGASSCWVGFGEYGFEEMDPMGNVLSTLSLGSFLWNNAAFDGTSFFVLGQESIDGGPQADVLIRVTAADGAATTLGTMPSTADVAVDDECVYWSNTQGVFSLSKTATGFFSQ